MAPLSRIAAPKRWLLAAGAATVIGTAAVGVAGAQPGPGTPTPTRPPGPSATAPSQAADQRYQQFLDALSSRLGVTSDRLRQALAETNQSLGLPDRALGGFGHHGQHRGHGGFVGASLDSAAQAIGITADQLRQELPGKSLTDVARAHNADPARVAGALKAAAGTRIDQAVSAGRLAADQANQLKQRANTQIDQAMTQALPVRGLGGFKRPGGPGGTPSGTPATPRSA